MTKLISLVQLLTFDFNSSTSTRIFQIMFFYRVAQLSHFRAKLGEFVRVADDSTQLAT